MQKNDFEITAFIYLLDAGTELNYGCTPQRWRGGGIAFIVINYKILNHKD